MSYILLFEFYRTSSENMKNFCRKIWLNLSKYSFKTVASNKAQTGSKKYCFEPREYGIEGRYNWSGSPYHIIIHALQTGTPFE